MGGGKGREVVVVRAGAAPGWWAVVKGNGERGAVREERKRVNTVYNVF